MVGLILKSALVLVGWLIAADIAGVVFLAIVEILPFDIGSAALDYVVWFVCGIFCGLFAYSMAGAWGAPKVEMGDWTRLPEAWRTGLTIVVTDVVMIAALCWLLNHFYWSHSIGGENYVPDSMSHSITYFVAVTGSLIFAQIGLRSTPWKKRGIHHE